MRLDHIISEQLSQIAKQNIVWLFSDVYKREEVGRATTGCVD